MGEERSGCIVWFTGLSASGKTTLCGAVAEHLGRAAVPCTVLDGDVLRQTLSRGLGFSRADREENVRRIGTLAAQTAAAGTVVLVAVIAPYRSLRAELRVSAGEPFFEVFVDAPLAVCERRDPKGLYARARAGLLTGFTGVDDVYEPPEAPDVHCCTSEETVEQSAAKVMGLLRSWVHG